MSGRDWYRFDVDEVLARLGSDRGGLSSAEATRRLGDAGPNEIPCAPGRTPLSMLFSQFSDFMILILLAAALVSGLVGDPQDSVAILVIVLLNALIGAVQEYRAERAVMTLRALAAPDARVRRDEGVFTVPAAQLVPGDVVLLEAGNTVPADLRLTESEELQANESALTGESQPVAKQTAALREEEVALGDRVNMAFKGSAITHGRGCGVVVATGAATEIGHVAAMLRGETRVRTPLQRRLARFGRYLGLAVLAICGIVFTAGLLQGQPPMLMFLTAVSLAVAAIPEALPAVVTISLALGARRLIRHKALVRNLPAVETLGSVTYICTDKTGTLTLNKMSVECCFAEGRRHDRLPPDGGGVALAEAARAMALSNDVVTDNGRPAGEPTELALFEAARAAGYDKAVLQQTLPRLGALAFDSERKRMTTLHRRGDTVLAYVKGAPEAVIGQCSQAMGEGGPAPLDAQALNDAVEQLSGEGYRVLAVAKRELASVPEPLSPATLERELTFLALVALIDPPRPEVPKAVADCVAAGITPVMITGDHPGTAAAIARRLAICDDRQAVLTGAGLEQLSEDAFAQRVGSIRVYARVSPQQKLRIIKALQRNGEFVAMTGDGVNDAPALKRAGIGIAMGGKGTDVAREAADMVLLDDNFATIVQAVRTGRRIFDNIRKFVKYTMSSNSGEIWTLFLAPFLGLPIPLLPIHILWINLVTDGLPGLAFTAEPAEPGSMRRPPRPPDESVFAHGMWQHILWVGLLIGGLSIAAQAWAIAQGLVYWQTVVFCVLTFSQLFHALAVRADSASLIAIGLTSNRPMLGAVLLTVLLQLAVIYVPALNIILHTQPLPLADLAACIVLSSGVLFAVEAEKWLVRRRYIYQGA